MENVFLQLVDMSSTAVWLVLAVLLLRLVLRKAPRWIHCALWALVAVRLICPISIESAFSWIPSAQSVSVDTFLSTTLSTTPIVSNSAPVTDVVEPPAMVVTPGDAVVSAPVATPQADPVTLSEILTIVWVAGMVALAVYALVTTLRLHRQVREAVRLHGNVWQSDGIATPFILGVLRPRIYLPTSLSEMDTPSVVAHERAHLKRRDHWWKPLGFALLTVYWFNPLLWVGYILLCRDIEAACDERVIRDMDVAQRKSYSQTILACSAPRHLITACPVAFGETAVKSRVKTVLNYKKPAFWLVLVAVVALVVSSVCLLTNPKTTMANEEEPSTLTEEPDQESLVGLSARFNWDVGYLGEEVYTEMKTQSADSDLPIFVMRNTTDLEGFIVAYDGENKIFTRNYSIGSGPAAQMREVYTEEYFKDSVVLAVYYQAASYMFTPEIVAAHYTEGGTKLTVMVDVSIPYMVNEALGGYMMMTSIDRAAAEKVTAYSATVRADIPQNEYIASFEKHRYMYQMKSTGYVREEWRAWLGEEEWKMSDLVKSLGWGSHGHKAQYSPYIGAINVLGETYYVNDQYDMLSTKEKTALLNAEQSAYVRSLFTMSLNGKVGPVPYLRENDPYENEDKPYKDYTYLYGRYMGHNKAERYVILDVVWAENAELVDKRVLVSLNELDGFGLPDMGAMIEIPYDGTVGERDGFPQVVSYGWGVQDDAAFPDAKPREEYPDVTGGNFTGKVLQVTDDSMLMECYDKSLFDTVWVNYHYFFPHMKPAVGDEYKIFYADGVKETAPPQVTCERIEGISYVNEQEEEFITETRAIEIASAHWEIQSGDKDPETGYVMSIMAWETPTREEPYYRMALRWLVETEGGTGNYSTKDTVYIDAVTEEIIEPGGEDFNQPG